MKPLTIILAGTIERVSSRKDKSLSIHFSTQEITPAQAGEIISLQGEFVKSIITNKEAIPYEVVEALEEATIQSEKKPKTKSQILRAKIWVRWKDASGSGALKQVDKKSFEEYYNTYMDDLISRV